MNARDNHRGTLLASRYRDNNSKFRIRTTCSSIRTTLFALCLALFVFFVGTATASSFPPTLDVPPGSRVAFEGDSLVYGQDETQGGRRPPINGAVQGRSANPLPERLSELLERQSRN